MQDKYHIYSQNVHNGEKTYNVDVNGDKVLYGWTQAYSAIQILRNEADLKNLKNTQWWSERVQ